MTTNEKKSAGKGKIIVGTDGSEASALAVRRAGQAIKLTNDAFELIVVNVIRDVVHFDHIPTAALYQEKLKIAQEIVDQAQKELKEHGVDCTTRIALGPVAQEIVRIAEEEGSKFIFIGSRGRGGMSRMLLGSVAEDVIRYAHCNVSVVRG